MTNKVAKNSKGVGTDVISIDIQRGASVAASIEVKFLKLFLKLFSILKDETTAFQHTLKREDNVVYMQILRPSTDCWGSSGLLILIYYAELTHPLKMSIFMLEAL